MKIQFKPDALDYLEGYNTKEINITSLVFTSCCSGPLPPEVKVGIPPDTDGFSVFKSGDYTIYYDSLLDEKDSITIGLVEYNMYRELVIEE